MCDTPDTIIERLTRLQSLFRPSSDASALVGSIIFDVRAIRCELQTQCDNTDTTDGAARRLARCRDMIERVDS